MKTARMYYDSMIPNCPYGEGLEPLRKIFSPSTMVEFAANYHEYCMRILRKQTNNPVYVKKIKDGFRGIIATLETIEALKLIEEGENYDELKYRVNYVTNLLNDIETTNTSQSSKKIENDLLPDVIQRSELVCMCKGTTQVNRINDRYICCTCNRPLM